MNCIIEGVTVDAKVVESLGVQCGHHTKAVEYEGKEYIVIRDSGVWRQRRPIEKLAPRGRCVGQ